LRVSVAILPFADDGLAGRRKLECLLPGSVAILPFADDGLAVVANENVASGCVFVAILPFADDGLAVDSLSPIR